MCNDCKRTRKKRAAAIMLAPVLLVAGPSPALFKFPAEHRDTPTLAEFLSTSASALAAEADKKVDKDAGGTTRYTCPMHPHYIADDMGTCPICGMDLVKLQSASSDLSGTQDDKRTIVTVSAETMQNMGVRLGVAEASTFGRTVRSYGIVHENERLQSEITSRAEGWVEDLKVTAVGDTVKKGDQLFKLYSPKIIVSQSDFLSSRGSPGRERAGLAQLRSYGVQDQAIKLIRDRGRPIEKVPFFAEADGTVSELMLKQGTYVKRGMMLAKIQDYSSVWLQVSVAEKDLGFISKSTSARVSFPNLPDRDVEARVDYVYPTIDQKTRTGQVRLVIENKDGRIRPGSYADVRFEVAPQKRIAVPSESILKNGDGKYVVVSLGEGRFEPRLVKTGLISERRTEIVSGLTANDRVVVSGQFLLDSESALRESFRKLEKLQLPLSLLKLSKTEFALIDHLVDASLYMHEALVDGYDVEAKPLDPAAAIKDLMWPKYKNTKLAFVLERATKAVKSAQAAKTESETQDALAALTDALRPWIADGAPAHYISKNVNIHKDGTSGRLWLQLKGKPINPYSRGGSETLPLTALPDTPKSPVSKAESEEPRGSMRGSHGG